MFEIYIFEDSNILISLVSLIITSIIAWYTIKYQKVFHEHQKEINLKNLELEKLRFTPYPRIDFSIDKLGNDKSLIYEINMNLIFNTDGPVILHELFIERLSDKKPFRGKEAKTISQFLYLMDTHGYVYSSKDKLNIFSYRFNLDSIENRNKLKDIADEYQLIFQYSNTINKNTGEVDKYIKRDKNKFEIFSIPVHLGNLKQFLDKHV